ncbi:MAG TPA: MFS transporter [Magnetospirillaceae bacterium]|jgi:FSR family fosmidomycin resistance protein-like MFS transporter
MENVQSMPLASAPASNPSVSSSSAAAIAAEGATMAVIFALSFSHMLNDAIQSLIPALYPMLKENFALSFAQIGLITLAFNTTGSILQPFVGYYTDKHPKTYALPIGMTATLLGLLLLAVADSYWLLLAAAAMVGTGSSVFHPESSRVARMASGGRHGMAQSMFQVGGNIGSSLGPLLAAFIVLQRGQHSVAWFSIAAMVAITVLTFCGRWYARERTRRAAMPKRRGSGNINVLSRNRVIGAIVVLFMLILSKYLYITSLGSYYTFYLMNKFNLPAETAQVYLFVFLFSVALGTVVGGPIGDRVGRKYVIWVSILGVLPFTLMLPHANLMWTAVLSVVIGLILSSAFSAILVFAQELVPGKVGLIAGIFFGFAFGVGGLGAAALGELADHTSIDFVYKVCAYLPIMGLLTVFLPSIETRRKHGPQVEATVPPTPAE